MFVATMDSEKFAWVGLGLTEEEARIGIAKRFDRHLEQFGDENRERFLAEIGLDSVPVEDGVLGETFGSHLAWFAEQLDEHYGIRTVELQPGEGSYN